MEASVSRFFCKTILARLIAQALDRSERVMAGAKISRTRTVTDAGPIPLPIP